MTETPQGPYAGSSSQNLSALYPSRKEQGLDTPSLYATVSSSSEGPMPYYASNARPDSASAIDTFAAQEERHSTISIEDNDSQLDLFDELPQAKPSVTSHDRLWAELGALQEDVERAKEIQRNRGFLGTKHAESLAALRTVQLEFALAIANEEEHLGLERYRELWNVSDVEVLRSRLFSDKHFELLSENVSKSSEILDDIAKLIEK